MKAQLIAILVATMVFGIALACTTEIRSVTGSHVATIQDSVKTWKTMDHEERIRYMRTEVLPEMRQLFAEFDPVRFDRINCKTCHGEGVTNETFKMPNPKLPKLPATADGFKELMKKDSAIMTFMAQKVKPRMAALLGMQPYDPKTNPSGFGCGNCHTTKQ